ncbi:MAG: TetR/AcrR family transcriptional regulator [Planctomycetes bacterium]|nr:TetR/AcrR family transcriptional regulator [Planctomycetota bacterium]MCH9726250.1 TetR/AcrR family transcriptional regulator [Planctomycetota bacterium]MCH9775755.1 TetR/AcrR family transcriptional regulator [Planctomycetota bacterium]
MASSEIQNKPQKKEASSQEAILKAAIKEFADRGVDGARIESVARLANFNKSLIYRYFTDKHGLFKAALQSKLEERADNVEKIPVDIAEILQYFFEENLRDQDYVRVLLNEAHQNDGDPIIDDPWRRDYYKKHIDSLKKSQSEGNLLEEIDPVCLMLILTSLVFFPATLPQLAQMITGNHVNSEEFKAQWSESLSVITKLLTPS